MSQRQPSWVSPAQWVRPGYENMLTFSPKSWPDARARAAGGVEVLLSGGFVSSSLLLSTGFCRCLEPRLILLLSHPPTFWATKDSAEVFPEEAHRRESVIKHFGGVITKTLTVILEGCLQMGLLGQGEHGNQVQDIISALQPPVWGSLFTVSTENSSPFWPWVTTIFLAEN